MANSDVSRAIRETLTSPNVADSNLEPANVVDALDGGLRSIARSLRLLGNADAATPMGGLEGLGASIIEAAEKLGGYHDDPSDAIYSLSVSVDKVAEAIEKVAAAISSRP